MVQFCSKALTSAAISISIDNEVLAHADLVISLALRFLYTFAWVGKWLNLQIQSIVQFRNNLIEIDAWRPKIFALEVDVTF